MFVALLCSLEGNVCPSLEPGWPHPLAAGMKKLFYGSDTGCTQCEADVLLGHRIANCRGNAHKFGLIFFYSLHLLVCLTKPPWKMKMSDGSIYYDVTEFLACMNLGVVLLVSTFFQLFCPALRAVAGEWHTLAAEACLISIFPHDIWFSEELETSYGREYIMLQRVVSGVLIQSAWFTLFPFSTFPAPPQQVPLYRCMHVLLYVLPLFRYYQQTEDTKYASALVLVLGGLLLHRVKRITWKRFARHALQGDKQSLAAGSDIDRDLLHYYERASGWIYGSMYCIFLVSAYLVWDVDLPSNTQSDEVVSELVGHADAHEKGRFRAGHQGKLHFRGGAEIVER
ncbi:hypothetical protein CYMTET_35902, partial [Cymbomonas tetramitiformis]